ERRVVERKSDRSNERENTAEHDVASGCVEIQIRPSRKWWISRAGAQRAFGYVSTGSAEATICRPASPESRHTLVLLPGMFCKDRMGLPGGHHGACCADRGIGPEDLGRLGRRCVDEAVGHVGGNEGRLLRAEAMLHAAHDGDTLALQHEYTLLAIV